MCKLREHPQWFQRELNNKYYTLSLPEPSRRGRFKEGFATLSSLTAVLTDICWYIYSGGGVLSLIQRNFFVCHIPLWGAHNYCSLFVQSKHAYLVQHFLFCVFVSSCFCLISLDLYLLIRTPVSCLSCIPVVFRLFVLHRFSCLSISINSTTLGLKIGTDTGCA